MAADPVPPLSPLDRAILLATRAHAGQTDKAGAPYILHPLRLMTRVRGAAQQMAAVLHDVVEDTPHTLDDLRAEGVGDGRWNAGSNKRGGGTEVDVAAYAANVREAVREYGAAPTAGSV